MKLPEKVLKAINDVDEEIFWTPLHTEESWNIIKDFLQQDAKVLAKDFDNLYNIVIDSERVASSGELKAIVMKVIIKESDGGKSHT